MADPLVSVIVPTHHTLPGWEPRFDLGSALDETIAWVRAAGDVAPHGEDTGQLASED